jgi:pimeloyl-ACP methyl ester carboxylesterase
MRLHHQAALVRSIAALVAVALLVVPACASSPHPKAAPSTLPAVAAPAPVSWRPCAAGSTARCASVSVPLDYRRPTARRLAIALAEQPASDPAHRIGALVYNPGGPGESGVSLLPLITSLLPPAVRARFDIVTFDERGTGASDRLVCGSSASTAGAAPLGGLGASVARSCEQKYGSTLGLFNTTAAARDLDRIRSALGTDRLTYLGLSYGTELGARYAMLFPTHVRAMVLDGAVDPTEALTRQAADEAPAITASTAHQAAACRATPSCLLRPDAEARLRQLAAQLRRQPLPAPGHGDDQPVTAGDLGTALLFHVTVPVFSTGFDASVAAALRGNGTPLRQTSLGLTQDTDGSSLTGVAAAFTCNDTTDRPSPATVTHLAASLAARYPLAADPAVRFLTAPCTSWPKPVDPISTLHVHGTPPLLVIGTTGDPNTPYGWAARLASHLDGSVVLTHVGWGHTWLLNDSGNACMRAAVTAYLVSGRTPAAGTRCGTP